MSCPEKALQMLYDVHEGGGVRVTRIEWGGGTEDSAAKGPAFI